MDDIRFQQEENYSQQAENNSQQAENNNSSKLNLFLNVWFFIVDLISLIILSVIFNNFDKNNGSSQSQDFYNNKYWAIATFIYHIISFYSIIHNLLKKKFASLIIQRRFLRAIDIGVFVLNHVLAWSVTIWGFFLWNKVEDNDILLYFIKFFSIYHVIIFSLFWLSMILICFFYICCYPVDPTDIENQTPTTKNMIIENSFIKTITEKFGLGDQCSICLENYDEGEEIRTLKCGHFYHKTCIDTWLERSQLCPNCRQKIDKGTDLKENAISLSNT